MSVVVITPPEPIVSLELAKKNLRVDHDDDDELIQLHIAAAQASIDGPDGWLGRAIGPQELELRLDGFYAADWRVGMYGDYAWETGWAGVSLGRWPFARRIALPFPPFVSVTSITYEDASGVDQVLTPTGWQASEEGVEPAFGAQWPSGRVAANAVRVRYQAGYVDAQGQPAVPARFKQAVLLMVGSLYANRESDVIDARAVVAVNPAVDALLVPYRVWRC